MLDKNEVIKVAKLSKLELKEEEIQIFSEQLPKIIDFIEKLEELNTEDIEPYYELIDIETPMREDEPEESLPKELSLKNAPLAEEGFFIVPRVVGSE